MLKKIRNFCGLGLPPQDPLLSVFEQHVEQDHRRVKFRLQPMLGFQRVYNARRVIAGIELAQKIHIEQVAVPAAFGLNAATIWANVLAP